MSITEKLNTEMKLWAAEMNKSTEFLATSDREKILEFLNDRENICTSGFLLRRQLQIKNPELVESAAEKSCVNDYADLTKCGNVAWPPKLIECLAKILTNTKFSGYGEKLLDIEKKQWQNYLLDCARCQRKSAVKLIFALDMDDATAAKFLLANGNDLLSWRNAFDYICKVCLKFGFTYENAESVFKDFSARCNEINQGKPTGKTENFTRLVKSETASFGGKDIIFDKETQEHLTATMFKYKDDFSEAGYSQQNIHCLQIFLKYLTFLYPTVDRFIGQDIFDNTEIERNADGTPKILRHLVTSMFDAAEIELPEYAELVDYGGPDLPQRGSLKRLYDNIPFTKNVLIPLKSLSQTLRAILRAVNHPKNAQAVNRETVLLLTYFFITGWLDSDDDTKEQFQAALESDMSDVAEESAEEIFLFALEDVAFAIDSLNESDEEPLKVYVASLNRMLTAFDFSNFYAPFVLDRFILLCLLSDERYIMNLIISESYRRSKKLLDCGEGGNHDEIGNAAPYR